jgi:hypothetical protein
MGGQACVFYGAAEFSRDTDLAILANSLIELAKERRKRPLLELVVKGSKFSLADALLTEEQKEREADREYWAPLKKELETLRHARAPLLRH